MLKELCFNVNIFMFHVEHKNKNGDSMNEKFMNMAYDEAKKSYELKEIPVGCVIVKDNLVISKAHNCKEKYKNAIMHAELLAVDKACKKNKDWRLDDCELYTTLEPCMMCMGAIIESRIKKIYYGTKNKNEQMYDINCKHISIINLNDLRCSEILSDFFKNRRKI